MDNKPTVKICATCQRINQSDMANFAKGIDQKIKDEMKQVDAQVHANKDKIMFSHTTCPEHYIQSLYTIPGMTEERIASYAEKVKQGNHTPCLLKNEPLRHAYMQGIFTTEQMNAVQQSNQNLTERFKKLAGIGS